MAGNSHAVGSGAYLQDIVVGLRHYAPHPTVRIPVSPPGCSGSGREGTDSYLMAVDIIPAGKKCGSVCYPVLVGNLNGVLERKPFYQAVEESSPPLLAAYFVCDDGRSVVSRLLHWRNSLAR